LKILKAQKGGGVRIALDRRLFYGAGLAAGLFNVSNDCLALNILPRQKYTRRK
jgi:hypothetical protein